MDPGRLAPGPLTLQMVGRLIIEDLVERNQSIAVGVEACVLAMLHGSLLRFRCWEDHLP